MTLDNFDNDICLSNKIDDTKERLPNVSDDHLYDSGNHELRKTNEEGVLTGFSAIMSNQEELQNASDASNIDESSLPDVQSKSNCDKTAKVQQSAEHAVKDEDESSEQDTSKDTDEENLNDSAQNDKERTIHEHSTEEMCNSNENVSAIEKSDSREENLLVNFDSKDRPFSFDVRLQHLQHERSIVDNIIDNYESKRMRWQQLRKEWNLSKENSLAIGIALFYY